MRVQVVDGFEYIVLFGQFFSLQPFTIHQPQAESRLEFHVVPHYGIRDNVLGCTEILSSRHLNALFRLVAGLQVRWRSVTRKSITGLHDLRYILFSFS